MLFLQIQKNLKYMFKYGADVPFLRPEKLSKDNVWSRDALKHAVINSEKYYKEKYDYVVELPATAPLRDYRDIDKAIDKLIKKKSDSVIGVSRVLDKHPIRIKKISNGKLDDYNKTLKEESLQGDKIFRDVMSEMAQFMQ